MRLTPVDIIFYSGSRADERPAAFVLDGERVEVERLIGERLIEGPDRSRAREFTLRAVGGRVFRLIYKDGEGYLVQEDF